MDALRRKIEEAQARLDHGDPELSGGLYSGKRNPTAQELESWRHVLDLAEKRGVIQADVRQTADGIMGRWSKVTLPERAVMADLIWTLTCAMRLGASDAPMAARGHQTRHRASRSRH